MELAYRGLFDETFVANEYLLVAELPRWLEVYTNRLKAHLRKKVGSYRAVNSRPHMTLSSFVANSTLENRVLDQVEHVFGGANPVHNLHIDKIGFYNTSYTIAMDVQSDGGMSSLQRELKGRLAIAAGIKKNIYFPPKLHVTIGRQLKQSQYIQASYSGFKDWKVDQDFSPESIVLLRKTVDGKYEPIRRFLYTV